MSASTFDVPAGVSPSDTRADGLAGATHRRRAARSARGVGRKGGWGGTSCASRASAGPGGSWPTFEAVKGPGTCCRRVITRHSKPTARRVSYTCRYPRSTRHSTFGEARLSSYDYGLSEKRRPRCAQRWRSRSRSLLGSLGHAGRSAPVLARRARSLLGPHPRPKSHDRHGASDSTLDESGRDQRC